MRLVTDTPTIKLYAPKEAEKHTFIGKDAAYRNFAAIIEAEKPHIAVGTRLNTPQVRGR